jgi:hypothetical protein
MIVKRTSGGQYTSPLYLRLIRGTCVEMTHRNGRESWDLGILFGGGDDGDLLTLCIGAIKRD